MKSRLRTQAPGYGVLDFASLWFLVKCKHRYAVSSLMDTAYRMDYRRPLITELRYKADSSDWTDVLSYFYREAADEDRRIATKLNRLREEILIVCKKRRNLADELMSIRGIVVVGKAAEFIIDTLRKDNVQINALCDTLTDVIERRENFVAKLDMLVLKFVSRKMVEFMKEMLNKDVQNLMKLQILGREFELRDREKDLFIEKLKGNMNY
ncbi:hypothetical protein Tco_1247186 [Tanacetum coccineum]